MQEAENSFRRGTEFSGHFVGVGKEEWPHCYSFNYYQ